MFSKKVLCSLLSIKNYLHEQKLGNSDEDDNLQTLQLFKFIFGPLKNVDNALSTSSLHAFQKQNWASKTPGYMLSTG